MHLRMQWRRLYARLVSIPAVTLFAIASAVAVLSKLSIAAASEQPEPSLPQPRLERASFAVVFEGIASYYAHAFHGRRTAMGSASTCTSSQLPTAHSRLARSSA